MDAATFDIQHCFVLRLGVTSHLNLGKYAPFRNLDCISSYLNLGFHSSVHSYLLELRWTSLVSSCVEIKQKLLSYVRPCANSTVSTLSDTHYTRRIFMSNYIEQQDLKLVKWICVTYTESMKDAWNGSYLPNIGDVGSQEKVEILVMQCRMPYSYI